APRRALARSARHEHPVRAVVGQEAEQADERIAVNCAIRIERRNHRCQDPTDCHEPIISGLSGSRTPPPRMRGEMATTAERDYSHRTTVQKLAVKPDERLEVSGDIGSTLRRELREEPGRGFIKSGEVDGAIALVESIEDAKELLARYRPRL